MPRSLAMVVDQMGAIRTAEGSALGSLGMRRQEVLGRSACDVFARWPRVVHGIQSALGGCPTRANLTIEDRTVALEFEPRLSGRELDGAVVVGIEAVVPMLLRQLPGVSWTTDRDLHITSAVGRLPAELPDNIVGIPLPEFIGSDDPCDPAIARHRAALAGEPQVFSYPFRDRWFHVHLEPLRDKAGDPCGCVGTAVDVTERRRAMKQVEATVSLLNAALEATADGLLVVDSSGHVAAYNERFSRMWRLPDDALARRDDAELLALACAQLEQPEDFLRLVLDLYGEPERESFDVLPFKDGRVFERYSRPQRVGARIVGRVWSFRDVSERERLLGRTTFLSEATRLLVSLDVERALDALVLLAVPYLGASCSIELFDGPTKRKVIAASPNHSHPMEGEFPRSVTEGHPAIFGDGAASRMAVPLLFQGKTAGAITLTAPSNRSYDGADLDLARQLAERAALSVHNAHLYRDAQEALNMRDEFLSIVAHEIRSPLTSIHLCAQTLRHKATSMTDMTKALEIIERADRRLGRFVDELLDVGRIQGGRFHFDIEPVDMVDVARAVAMQLGDEAARARTSISVHADGAVLGQWDRFRLEQVTTNLLSNALKFGMGKPVSITVCAAAGFATLKVRDHGAGIPPELHERVFLPFERAVSTRHFGGLGLGLYIARTIIEGLGGSIGVASGPGEGSTFTVKLPQARSTP